MQYRTLGRTGIKASAAAFGGVMLNCMEQGEAGHVLGPALAPYRNKVSLACKSGPGCPKCWS